MSPFDKVSDSFKAESLSPADVKETTSERLAAVMDQFQSHGVKLNPSCRLSEYARLFEQEFRYEDLVEQKHRWAYLEAMQFSLIARALPQMLDDDRALAKLQVAVGGSMHPSIDSAEARARSDQFELYTMAVLTLSGFEVKIDEPDLWVQVEGDRIPIAVKRPRSVNKVFKLIRKGSNQIASCGTPGVVALDLSFVEDLAMPIFQSVQHQQVLSKVFVDGFANENDAKLNQLLNQRSELAGYLLHLSACVTSMNPLKSMVSRRWLGIGKRPHTGLQTIIGKLQALMSS